MPDLNGKTPEKRLSGEDHGSERRRPFFPIARSWVLPRIFYLQVCSASLWQKYSNAEDSLFSTIYNGRNDSRLENTVCMLVKTLPVYCKFDPKTTVQAYMAELSEQMLSSMANDIFPIFRYLCKIRAEFGSYLCIPGRVKRRLSNWRHHCQRPRPFPGYGQNASADPGKRVQPHLCAYSRIPQRHVQPGLY